MLTLDRVHLLPPLVDRMESFVRDCDSLPGLVADRDSLLGLVHQLRDLHDALGTPLKVLLVGGTGAGKSTLLNAIAGADIAKVSALRPTTREFVCYYHRAAGTGSLGPVEATAVLRPHDREELREKILLDAPDFDSALRDNRRHLLEALATADLVLCLVTPEKYLGAELFRLLEEHRQGRSFVFIMNRADLGVDDALVNDFRAALRGAGLGEYPVLRLSAKNALTNRVHQAGAGAAAGAVPLPEGDFPALESLLERELDRVRIREIKSRNLVERVDLVLARIERHVPEKAEERLLACRRERDDALVALVGDLCRQLVEPLFRFDGIPALVASVGMTRFRFVFGAFAALFTRLQALAEARRGRAGAGDPGAIRGLVHERLTGLDRPSLAGPLAVFARRVRERGRAAGFAFPATLADPGDRAAGAAVGAVEREVLTGVDALYDPESGVVRGGVLDLALNLPPLVLLGFALVEVFRGYFGGHPVGTDYLTSTVVILAVICYVEWWVARAAGGRSVLRTTQMLEDRAWRALRQTLGEETADSARALAAVEARLAELRRLRADLTRVQKGEG